MASFVRESGIAGFSLRAKWMSAADMMPNVTRSIFLSACGKKVLRRSCARLSI